MILRRIRKNAKFKALMRVKEGPIARIHRSDFSLIAVLLLLVPLFYIYQLFPKGEIQFVYDLTTNLAPIVILSIWFITCRRWYYRYIALPLLVFFCQLCSAIVNGEIVVYDHLAYLPLGLPLLYLISRLRRLRLRLELRDSQERAARREGFISLMGTLRGGREAREALGSDPKRPVDKLKGQRFKLDYVIVGVLLLSVPLSYAYLLFPETESFLFIHSRYFQRVQWSMYHFFQKADAILLLLAWFVSSRKWWWYIIGWPLLMYCFQMISLVSVDTGLIGKDKILYLIPLTLVLIYPLYRARKFLYWDIFHEDWEKNPLSRWQTARCVLQSLTDFIILCLTMYLIQTLLLERPLPIGNPDDPQRSVVFQGLFVALLLGWFLSAKDWWFFLLPFPLLFCLFNAMTSLGAPKVIGVDKAELYYLLPVFLLALHPFYRLRHYIFEEMYESQVEKERYIEASRLAAELLERNGRAPNAEDGPPQAESFDENESLQENLCKRPSGCC